MWWRVGLSTAFFRVLVQCCDVIGASCDYKRLKSRHRKSHASHHRGMFIYNFKKMTVRRDLPLSSSVSNNFLCGQLLISRQNPPNDIWFRSESVEETAEDRRSICVLTEISATFTATSKQQTELLYSIWIMQLIMFILYVSSTVCVYPG